MLAAAPAGYAVAPAGRDLTVIFPAARSTAATTRTSEPMTRPMFGAMKSQSDADAGVA